MNFKILLKPLTLLMLVTFVTACEEAFDPYPAFETVPHSFGKFKTGTPTSFIFGNAASKLEGDLQWISTDSKVKVTEMDLFVTWSESYKDKDGLPKTATHGKKKIKSITNPGDQRVAQAWSMTAAEVQNAFKGATFDYGDGKGKVDVFAKPKDLDRTATNFFTSNDKFVISWALKADDGRYFDTWSQGICSETVGSNCSLTFGVICVSTLEGTYTAVTEGGISTDDCCKGKVWTNTSEVTLKSLGSGKYEISDFSAGLYRKWYEVYGITAAYEAGTDKTKNKLRGDILDACNKISGSWAEPFQDGTLPLMTITGVVVDASKGIIKYDWKNGYDDKGTVTLTKK